MKRKPVFCVVLAILAVAFLWVSYQVKSEEVNRPTFRFDEESSATEMIGKEAPGFKLSSLDGRDTSLSDFKGQPVLIGFWAAWHPMSPAATSILDAFDQQFGASGLKVLSVNQRDLRSVVVEFVKKNKHKSLVLLDEEGAVGDEYSLAGVPSFVLIDKNGRVHAVKGTLDPGTLMMLEGDVRELLGLKGAHERPERVEDHERD